MAMKNVPRFSLLAIVLLWANTISRGDHQKRSTISSLTTTLSMQACQAFIKPKELIVFKHTTVVGDYNPEYSLIKCGGTLSNNADGFSYPAIDLSFGDNTQTGIFIVRGMPECRENHTRCESEFRVATMALKKLLSNASLDATVLNHNNNNNHKDKSPEMVVNHHHHQGGDGGSFVIRFSCNIADTARNSKLPVRCSDSGTIRYAKEIEHGQPCLAMLNAPSSSSRSNDNIKIPAEECGRNMQCVGTGTGSHKCKCKKNYIETRDISGKVICIESVAIFQKCMVNKQCTAQDPNTWCQSHLGLGYKTCQCVKDYQPNMVTSQSNQMVSCQPYKLVQAESSSSYLNQSGSNGQSADKTVNQYGLIIFVIVLFIVIILAIIFLSLTKRKHGITQYKQASKRAKNKLNGNHPIAETVKSSDISVLGLAYNQNQNDDDDEDVEVKIYDIDDQSDIIRRGNMAKVIQEPPDQETNFTEQAPNFDIFAKQSVV